MDFNPTPEQVDAAALARSILTDRVTVDRQKAVEATGARFDAELFRELSEAGLVGVALPEEYGGAGLTLQELTSVITECGRVVAPLPLAWHGPTALAVAEFGSDAQKAAWLTGTSILTSAFSEDRADVPEHPTTNAVRNGDSWVVTGAKTVVPAGTVAGLFVVPASTDEGVTVFLVEPSDEGVSVDAQTTNDGDQVARLELAGVALAPDRVLGPVGGGSEIVAWLAERLTTCVCALQLGIVEGALELTSSYAKEREQFGRPIGSFQAVSQRLADGFIDVLGLRLTTWQATWRLTEGLPAESAVAVAKLWAADTGHKVAHTTVHVHGGVGIDLDGAAHRYFTGAKRLELMLGGTTMQARTIGRALAAEPA